MSPSAPSSSTNYYFFFLLSVLTKCLIFFLSIKVYAVYAWDTHLAGLIKVDPKNKYSNSILMTTKVT